MSRELIALLMEATVVASAAIAVVLLLRRPLRAGFGNGAAYLAWCLVPASLVATLLPAAVAPAAPARIAAAMGVAIAMPSAPQAAAFDPQPLLATLWALGLLAMAGRLLLQQRRFVAGLGPLQVRGDGLLQSRSVAGLPAVIGWRARIVLPDDFEQRYSPEQQRLVLCHEQVHQRRGDLAMNALVALLRALFWFNPLVHFAAGRFRHDQELACDAAVLARHPGQRRAYGDALLKTQLAERPLPVGCHWFGSHPLKERITMLKRPLPGKSRWFAGLVLVLSLTLAGAWTAWAAQPARVQDGAAGGDLALTLKVRIDGQGEQVETLNVQGGKPHTFDFSQDGQAWRIVLTLTPRDDGTIYADAVISRDGVTQGQPKLVFKPASAAVIHIGKEGPDAGGQGIHLSIEADAVVVSGSAVSPREAARRVAANAGLTLANPQALGETPRVDFRFNDIPAQAALQIIASEAGRSLRIEGDQVYFDLAQGVAGSPPDYPAASLAAREGGTVMLRVRVGTAGQVLESEYLADKSTLPAGSPLVASTLEASRAWKFNPRVEDGQPVEGWVLVPVTFDPAKSNGEPAPR